MNCHRILSGISKAQIAPGPVRKAMRRQSRKCEGMCADVCVGVRVCVGSTSSALPAWNVCVHMMRVYLRVHEPHAWICVHGRKGVGSDTQVCVESGGASKGFQLTEQVLIGIISRVSLASEHMVTYGS